MNIFYLSNDPVIAARAQTDKHVVKMILESAQLLSTAHRVLDGTQTIQFSKSGARLTRYDHPNDLLYKSTHINHPSAIWVRESLANYKWLYEHFLALSAEYTTRYGKVHATYTKLADALKLVPRNIPSLGLTPIKLAIADDHYHLANPVDSYRAYYVGEKLKLQSDIDRYNKIIDN